MHRSHRNTMRASVVLSAMLALSGISGCTPEQSSASLLADAKQYQQKGDHKAALIQLKNAANKNPADSEVRFELARSYIEAGDAVSAEKEIRKALSLGFDHARATPLLAKSLLMQGQAKQALEAISAAETTPELLLIRGDALAATGAEANAIEAYEAVLAAKPGSTGALIGLARLSMARNDISAATTYVDQALTANPQDPDAWMFKGAMLRLTGKPEEALAAYSEVIKRKPDHMNALIERAQVGIDTGKIEAAQADINAARKAAPNAVVVKYTQALLDFKQQKFAAAKESLQQVMKHAPNYMPAVLLSGAVDLNLKAYQQAELSLKRYVERFPGNAYARKLLAQAQLQGARPDDATTTLAPLLDEASKDSQLMALAGISAARSNDFDKATDYFARASAIDPKSAPIRTSLGMSKINSGNAEAGIGELKKAVELDPSSSEAVLALMQAQLRSRKFDDALATAAKAQAHHAKNAVLHNLVGGAYLGKSDMEAARASFEKAAALQPADLGTVLNLAQLDMRTAKPDAAKKRIEAFLQKNPKDTNAMFALADLAASQGQKEQAAVWLEKAAAAAPTAAAPAIRLGAHYLATNQINKALTLARKARATAPDNPELADLLGMAQIASKDLAGALETYSALARAAPKAALPHLRLARVHALMKDQRAAVADLERAVALQPNYLPARLAQVEFAISMGKTDEALAMARQMQSAFPTSPVGFVVEGDVQQKQKPEQAAAAYRKALAMTKTPALSVKLADALRRSGKHKEAESHMTEWIKANPSDVLSRNYLAELHLANKQYKPAAEIFESLLKQQPENAALLNNLAWSYQQIKDPRALEMAERAVKLAPANPSILDTLGWMLAEKGETGRALPLLQKAVAAAPEAHDIRYHLAATLNKSGDKAGARKELEKLLSSNKPFPQAEEAKALLKTL